jgi:predicted DNA-binding transcriptional regulator YafY
MSDPLFVQNEEVLAHAVEAEQPVHFRYVHPIPPRDRLPGGPTEDDAVRKVSPYEVRESLKGDTYVFGYDHDHEALRNFRVERIEGLVELDESVLYRPPIEEVPSR